MPPKMSLTLEPRNTSSNGEPDTLGVPGPKSIESSPSPVAVPAATSTTPGPEESPNRRRPPTVKTMVSSPAPGLTLDTLVVIVSSPPSPKIWSLKRRLKAPSVILSLPGPPWSSSGSSDPAMTSSPGPPKTLVTRTAPVMSMWSLPSPPQMTSVPPCAGDRVVSLEAVDHIVARRTRESIVPATADNGGDQPVTEDGGLGVRPGSRQAGCHEKAADQHRESPLPTQDRRHHPPHRDIAIKLARGTTK